MVTHLHKLSIASAIQHQSILNFFPIRTVHPLQNIKMHLFWLAATRTGHLDDKITDTTLRNRLSSLRRAIKLYTGYQYNSAQNKELENYIAKELVHKGKVATEAYQKPVAHLVVAEDLIRLDVRRMSVYASTCTPTASFRYHPHDVYEQSPWRIHRISGLETQ
jgi:hypothetical protein